MKLSFFWTITTIAVSLTCPSFGEVSFAFPRPAELEPNIGFWKKVYSEWSSEKIAFHDEEDLSIIYKVIDVPTPSNERLKKLREEKIKKTKEEIRLALGELEAVRPHVAREVHGVTKEIFLALKDIKRTDKYRRIDFIRGQSGQMDKFAEGYYASGAHIGEMQERFRLAGLPEELVAIVFVESMFHPRARSSAGAAGLWQFLKGTAKEYMCVNDLVDERFDPILATDAAIAYLKSAREKMIHWPLAITSYNYGRAGILKAMNTVSSTDFSEILRKYEHDRFGFASKNYYSEFLAALEVLKDADRIFAKSGRMRPWDYQMVQLKKPVSLASMRNNQEIADGFRELNPALTKEAFSGKEILPVGFSLRVPKANSQTYERLLLSEMAVDPKKAESRIKARHKANGRQSLEQIAKIYDIFKDQLAERFGYAPSHKIDRGKVVLIRSLDSRFTPLPNPVQKKPDLKRS